MPGVTPSAFARNCNREYHLTTLNRGQSAAFNFWVNSNVPQASPVLNVTTEKSGVRLISRPSRMLNFDRSQLLPMVVVGIGVAVPLVYYIAVSSLSGLTKVGAAFAIGITYNGLGFLVLQLIRLFRRLA